MSRFSLIFILIFYTIITCHAQEIDAKIKINHQKIDGTEKSIYENLEQSIQEFINTRQWTHYQYKRNEKIKVSLNLSVNKYDQNSHSFECTLNIQAVRPVFNSSYTTTLFAYQDPHFNFKYQPFEKLEFRSDLIENELTALLAFYSYLIIGFDNDGMSLFGGTQELETAQLIVNNAQNFSSKGWKAFDNSQNRYTIINNLLDNSMKPFRQLQYVYYREGLDEMSENTNRARTAITNAIELLQEAHKNKPLSMLPLLFTEYKGDEIVNIYKNKGTEEERQNIKRILGSINPSKMDLWRELR